MSISLHVEVISYIYINVCTIRNKGDTKFVKILNSHTFREQFLQFFLSYLLTNSTHDIHMY